MMSKVSGDIGTYSTPFMHLVGLIKLFPNMSLCDVWFLHVS